MTLPRVKKNIDLTQWYKGRKDEPDYKRSKQHSWHTLKQRRATPRPELHHAALLRVAWMMFERKDLMEYAESLTDELNVPLERLYFIALVGFFEKYEENLRVHADESNAASSYREADEYTEEEFNAILEADELEPELAELYKDLLKD